MKLNAGFTLEQPLLIDDVLLFSFTYPQRVTVLGSVPHR